jgi:hypothetical protein
VSLPLDREGDLARHVYDALEDEAAQPLAGLEQEAPEGFEAFSELETSLSELSFGYGVAWALARVREPFASSRRVSELAAQAVATAWRSFSEESWRALMEQDRAARNAAGAGSEPPARLDEFMGGLARARSRRPREGEGEGEETSGGASGAGSA